MSFLYSVEDQPEFLEESHLTEAVIDEISVDVKKFIETYFLKASLGVLSLFITSQNVDGKFDYVDEDGDVVSTKLIIIAIWKNRSDLFDFVLELGANPNSIGSEIQGDSEDEPVACSHLTALNVACRATTNYYLLKLLDAGADPNYVPPAIFNRTVTGPQLEIYPMHPICEALCFHNFSYCDDLMNYGADINFDNGNMLSTPLWGLLEGCYMFSYHYKDVLNIIELTLNKGIILDRLIHPYLAKILYDWDEDFGVAVTEILLKYGIDPNMEIFIDDYLSISPGTYLEFLNTQNNELYTEIPHDKILTPLDIAFSSYSYQHRNYRNTIISLLSNGADISLCYKSKEFLDKAVLMQDKELIEILTNHPHFRFMNSQN